jgi:amidophosphoribosyltransferase
MVAMTRTKLIGARDANGIRPLVLGDLDGHPIFASETCALDIIGAKFVRDVKNGEVIVAELQPDGRTTITSSMPFGEKPERLCLFEYVYFARPDSVVAGRSVYAARKRMGINLANESPVAADVVVPVPDGGTPAAIGYAQASGIPFELGIIRNHYVGRTFIEPADHTRHLGVRLKHNANRALIEGKRIVLVDDSIVRGTTSMKIVEMVRNAGAREVHMRIAAPPTTDPCFYGIDTPDKDKLLASRYDVAGMAKFIGVDSLAFLSIDGLYRAMGLPGRDPNNPGFCDACFTGDYPISLDDVLGVEDRQLSLLVESA